MAPVTTSIQIHQVIFQCHQRTSDLLTFGPRFPQSDGVQQTTYLAQHYCQEAIRQISMLRPSAERDALIRLTEMVLTRDKWSRSCPGLTSGSYYWACSLASVQPNSHSRLRQARVGHWGVRWRESRFKRTSGVCFLVLIMRAAEPRWVQTQRGWSGTWRSSWIDSLDTSPLPRP